MTSSSPPARPSILLVGGPASRGWRPGLEAAGLEVREVAWLEAVTAARMRRPDLLLLGADLPRGALAVMSNTIRSSDLRDLPIAVAGLEPEAVDAEAENPFRADHHFPAPVEPAFLARQVRRALGIGRVPWRPRATDIVIAALALLSAAPLFVLGNGQMLGVDFRPHLEPGEGLLRFSLSAFLGAGFLAVVTRTGVARLRILRGLSGLGWYVGLLAMRSLVRMGRPHAALAAIAASLLLGSSWAYLGLKVRPRSVAARISLLALSICALVLCLLPIGYLALYG